MEVASRVIPEDIQALMSDFWGRGPGSREQLDLIAGQMRLLDRPQVELLGAYIPPGQGLIGERCERLRGVVRGVLAEFDAADLAAREAAEAEAAAAAGIK